MDALTPRRVADSMTTQTYLVLPPHLNAGGCLYGGQLMSWIDMLAGIVAMRHCDSLVVTVCVDKLEFKKSAYANDVVTLVGRVTRVGGTSLEVRIDTYRENKGGEKILINTAYLVMVSLDDNGKPQPVPPLIVETEEEKRELAFAERRAELRRMRRDE